MNNESKIIAKGGKEAKEIFISQRQGYKHLENLHLEKKAKKKQLS